MKRALRVLAVVLWGALVLAACLTLAHMVQVPLGTPVPVYDCSATWAPQDCPPYR